MQSKVVFFCFDTNRRFDEYFFVKMKLVVGMNLT